MAETEQLVIGDVSLDTSEGEAAHVLDPLWMLGRQWQLGELDGEDNGSPVGARMVVEASMLGRWQPGAGSRASASIAYPVDDRPAEAHVEAEYWDTGTHAHFRLSAEIGLNLQHLLAAAHLSSTTTLLKLVYPLSRVSDRQTSDAASERYVRLMAGRVIDGMALYRSLQPLFAENRLQDAFARTPLALATEDHPAILEQLTTWLNDCASFGALMLTTPEPMGNAASWQRERMEYAFATSARLDDGEVTLVAREHFEGEADWYAYVLDPSRSLGSSHGSAQQTFTFLPTSVQFPGMPKPRFWELEDAHVNLPRLAKDRTDAASSLFIDFALRYSNDWFSVPLPLPAGSVSRVRSLVVTNTFGERLLVPHAGTGRDGQWKMFALTAVPSGPAAVADAGAVFAHDDVFLLPLTLGQVLDGAPVEQVRFARDEMANIGWAVEGVVESTTGHRIDRAEQHARSLPASGAASAPAPDALPRYRLGSSVPDHWVPLLPETGKLLRGAAPRMTDGRIEAILPTGRVLEPGQALSLFAEEVPREGVVVTRRYRYVRSADGHALLWIGRQKRPGQGEASSGLRFDTVEPAPLGQAQEQSPEPVTPKLMGWWRFDELSGTTVKDWSDFQNHGKLNNPNQVRQAGKIGNSLIFNGTSDYVDIPVNGMTFPGRAVTLSLWTYGDASLPTAIGYGSVVVSAFKTDGTVALTVCIPYVDGSILFRAGSSTDGGDTKSTGVLQASQYKGQWNHWVFAKDDEGFVRIYLNGSLFLADPNWGSHGCGTIATFRIGKGTSGKYDASSAYKGMLDEIRLYNYALSATDVTNLYSADSTVIGVLPITTAIRPAAIMVTPPSYIMADGLGAAFSAVAQDGLGHPLPTATIDWAVADSTAAQFKYGSALRNTFQGPNVIVHGRKDGVTTLTASSGGVSTTVQLDVRVRTIVLVQVYGVPTNLIAGDVVQAEVSVKDNSGAIVPFPVAWTTSNAAVATVSPAGLITAVDPGTATITATSAAASGILPITVAPGPAVVTPGLMGWWRFDELSGATVKDWSGFQNHGTLNNPNQVRQAGKIGNSLTFNGTSDYVDVPVNGMTFPGKAVTLSLWTYGDASLPTATGYGSLVVSAFKTDGNVALTVCIPYTDGSIFFRAGSTDGADTKSTGVLQASQYKGQWNHWVFTKNDGGFAHIYLNGSLVLADPNWGGHGCGTIATFRIGKGTPGKYDASSAYKGMLDEIRLYNYALSATDVANLYSADSTKFSG